MQHVLSPIAAAVAVIAVAVAAVVVADGGMCGGVVGLFSLSPTSLPRIS